MMRNADFKTGITNALPTLVSLSYLLSNTYKYSALSLCNPQSFQQLVTIKAQMATRYINKLQNHRVLVLGGSSGIGYAVAEAALEHGASVIISSSNKNKIDNALQRLKAHSQAAELPESNISGEPCDLTNPDTLEDNIKNLLEFATLDGKLDHVVFTAGDSMKPPSLESVTVEDISKLSMVRVTGAIFLSKHLPRYINQTTHNSLTVTASTTDCAQWARVGPSSRVPQAASNP